MSLPSLRPLQRLLHLVCSEFEPQVVSLLLLLLLILLHAQEFLEVLLPALLWMPELSPREAQRLLEPALKQEAR